MFELAEEALHLVALTVNDRVDGALDFPVALGRDVGAASTISNPVENGLSVTASVGDESLRWRQAADEGTTAALSEAWPAESRIQSDSPSWFSKALILELGPPRERPMA
nr:hypothetical protein [Ancylobacter sp. Lp-2]